MMKQAIVLYIGFIWFGMGIFNSFAFSAEPIKNAAGSRTLKIAWFSTMAQEEKTGRLKMMHTDFWPTTKLFVVAAAEDLEIDLSIYYANANFVVLLQQVEEALSNEKTRPDGMIFHNWKGNGEKMLQIAERYGVKSFVFNAGFPSNHSAGNPREKYKNWVGQMYPDDEHAGYLLARNLIQVARKLRDRKDGGALEMVALEGNRLSEASNLRTKGLKRAMGENTNVRLHQYFHSKWSRKLGGDAFEMTLQRYPETTVFWAASESMAIGVIEKAALMGRIPGQDIITGGIDLLPCNFHYLQSGKMNISIGGHYLEGAWALIALHDYLKGHDFMKKQSMTFKTKMISVSVENINEYGDLASLINLENIKRIDFKKYSKAYNSGITDYQFQNAEVLKQLGQ